MAYKVAVPVLALAIIAGLGVATFSNSKIDSIQLPDSDIFNEDRQQSEEDKLGALGSTHDHALFHIVVNGTEKDLTDRKFQFNNRFVHLENNNSRIVHKHAEGVTWQMFLDTVNIDAYRNGSQQCIEIYSNRSCGNGSVVLNGDFNASLDKEISQGDNLLIIINTEEWNALTGIYMDQKLPKDYRPNKLRGRSV